MWNTSLDVCIINMYYIDVVRITIIMHYIDSVYIIIMYHIACSARVLGLRSLSVTTLLATTNALGIREQTVR